MLTLTKTSPRHRVTVYRRNIKASDSGQVTEFEKFDVSPDVKMVQTNKSLGKAGGGFQITLSYTKRFEGKTYDRLFSPNDVVFIELKRDASLEFHPVMIAIVDRVERAKAIDEQGSPKFSANIYGTDFGKLLFKHDCGYDIQRLDRIDGTESIARQSAASARGTWFQYSGTATENIKNIMQNLFFPQIGTWVQQFMDQTFKHVVSDSAWRTFNKTIHEQTGPVWNAMKQFADEPYNILFTDIDPNDKKFHLFLRKFPFDNTTGKLEDTIYRHFINDGDIVTEGLGRNDADLKNYVSFENYAPLYGGDSMAYMFAKYIEYDEDSVAQFGFRPFRPQSGYSPVLDEKHHSTADKGTLYEKMVKDRNLAFYNWHRRCHEYESGVQTLTGYPEIRIGEALQNVDTGMEYYIESVTQIYTVNQSLAQLRTKLELTRGQKA